MCKMYKRAFTLIELLIVIAIIAIIASVIFVALDPLTRFQDSRDSVRWQEASELMTAIKIDQVDNGGAYLPAITAMDESEWYMIVDGAMDTGCDDHDGEIGIDCDIDGSTNCVDLAGLVSEGYIGDVPVSPVGIVTWDDGNVDGDEGTGYAMMVLPTGAVFIQACESENSSEIIIVR